MNLQISRNKEELINMKGPVTYNYLEARRSLQTSRDHDLATIKGRKNKTCLTTCHHH